MSSRPASIQHVARRAAVAVSLAAVTMLAAPAAAGAQQGPTEPSVPDLIVPGDTTATTAPAIPDEGELEPGTPAGTPDVVTGDGDEGLAASTKVWIIIGGLVGVALLVLILTVLYWRRTKPAAVAARAGTAPEPEEAPPVTPAAVPPGPDVVATPEPAGGEASPVSEEEPLDPKRSVFAPEPRSGTDADA